MTFYGALFRQGDVWICMEVMDASLDQFYKKVSSVAYAAAAVTTGFGVFAIPQLIAVITLIIYLLGLDTNDVPSL